MPATKATKLKLYGCQHPEAVAVNPHEPPQRPLFNVNGPRSWCPICGAMYVEEAKTWLAPQSLAVLDKVCIELERHDQRAS